MAQKACCHGCIRGKLFVYEVQSVADVIYRIPELDGNNENDSSIRKYSNTKIFCF